MPLTVQGNKLFPGQKNVVWSRVGACSPDAGGGNSPLDSSDQARLPLGLQHASELLRLGIALMRQQIEQARLEPLRIRVAELDSREFLEMIVREPGVIEDRLNDQCFPPRNGGAMAPQEWARCKLRTQSQVRAR